MLEDIDSEVIIKKTTVDLYDTFKSVIPLDVIAVKGELYPSLEIPAMTIIQEPDSPLVPESRFGVFPDKGNRYTMLFDYGLIEYLNELGRPKLVRNITAHEFAHVIMKSPLPDEELTLVFDEGLVSRWKLFFMSNNILPRIYGDSHWIAGRIREKELNLRSISEEELITKARENAELNELFAIVFGNTYSDMRPIQRWRFNRGIDPYIKDFYERRNIYIDPGIIVEVGHA